MKNYAQLTLALLAGTSTLSAAPFLAIGDGAELFATGVIGVRADDNIYLSSKKSSDTIFDVNPGLTLVFGKGADLKGSITLVDAFANYADNSKLNTNLFSGDFAANFEDGKSKLGFNLGYHEQNQNTVDIGNLVRRDQFVTGGTGEVEVSQLLSVAAGASYDRTNYKRKGYGDIDLLTIPIDIYYKWTPKTDISFGYRYRNSQVQIGSDSTDHFVNVGLRGEIGPKLTGRVAAGLAQRELSSGPVGSTPASGFTRGSKTTPGLEATVNYAYSTKTSASINASNDYNTNPTGAQQKNFGLGAQVNSAISPEWAINGGLSYRNIGYYTRNDDYWETQVGASYIVNSIAKITGSYAYRKNKSAVPAAGFTNNVFTISAALRY
jgi:polysaccharide biosynthesis protein VpsM